MIEGSRLGADTQSKKFGMRHLALARACFRCWNPKAKVIEGSRLGSDTEKQKFGMRHLALARIDGT